MVKSTVPSPTQIDREDATPILPSHIVETIAAIGKLHDDHHRAASRAQRLAERATAVFARPAAVLWITFACVMWMYGNRLIQTAGGVALDPPPFMGCRDFSACWRSTSPV